MAKTVDRALWKIRCWLLKKLIGKAEVAVNVTVRGAIKLTKDRPCLVHGCTFMDAPTIPGPYIHCAWAKTVVITDCTFYGSGVEEDVRLDGILHRIFYGSNVPEDNEEGRDD